MNITKCKYCQSTQFYLKDSGPHVGLFCQTCGKYQKWVPQCDIMEYQRQGITYELYIGGHNNHIMKGDK